MLRRALVLEPGLNPNPIFNAPALFFFVRPFVTIVLIGITLLSVRDRRFTLIEYGAIIAAISLVTPSQASYHQFLFFPAVAAAIHRTADVKVQLTWAVAFALICSNYMGAFTRFDAGPLMMLAFPRVFIIFAMWMAFLGERLRPRFLLPIAAIVALAGTITEYRRWAEDERDNARMVHPERRGLMETHPIVGPRGLVYTSLGRAGYTRPPDPALAIRELDGGYLLVENNQELFRREKVIRDPAISPDGAFISVAEWVDNRYRIQEWDRRDGTIRTLLSGPADYRYPAYDPSGQWLAFATNESGNWDLARISRRDGHKEFLTTSKANDLMPAFSLDGKTLYFASDRRRGYRFTAIYAIALSR